MNSVPSPPLSGCRRSAALRHRVAMGVCMSPPSSRRRRCTAGPAVRVEGLSLAGLRGFCSRSEAAVARRQSIFSSGDLAAGSSTSVRLTPSPASP
eukprot:scaffold49454_cov71-Phaeocystis_antarctica.AAC.1